MTQGSKNTAHLGDDLYSIMLHSNVHEIYRNSFHQNACNRSAVFRWESYKVLGSMNILGDPIGWTLSVGGAAISESVKEAWYLFSKRCVTLDC